ncbi:hypothetical protein [Streptomyces huasconensis]|uniref:hypothetical protein n=1 Tax=Streptomyces huasconensis TaxID=1854574 RepID=UPI0033CEAD54
MTTPPENPATPAEPSTPSTSPAGRPPTGTPRALTTRKRLHRLRRTAATHLFRGLCYGLGTAASGLLGYWIQQQYL